VEALRFAAWQLHSFILEKTELVALDAGQAVVACVTYSHI
jgi:hypothetical protein